MSTVTRDLNLSLSMRGWFKEWTAQIAEEEKGPYGCGEWPICCERTIRTWQKGLLFELYLRSWCVL